MVTIVAHGVGPFGGMERQLHELIRGLLERRLHVVLIANRCELEEHERFKWVRVPGPTRPFPLAYAWFFVAGSLATARHRRGILHTTGAIVFNQADVTTVHFCHHGFARKMGRRAGSRRSRLYRLNARLAELISLWAERWCYSERRVRAVVAVSDGVADELRQSFPDLVHRIRVIPNGVDAATFRPDAEVRKDVRRELGLDPDALSAIFVGGDWERKGLELCLRALTDARAWSLVVVGDGDRERYRALAAKLEVSDRVYFAGKSSAPERYYSAADALLLPSQYEAFPLVILEAAAAGLPLVLSDVNGAPDIVSRDSAGWIIERDPLAIANRLKTLAADSDLRDSLGRTARVRAENFSWTSVISKYALLYEELGFPTEKATAASRRTSSG
jgi:glycosyltransferase involved in cell wall biosynthesis